MNQMTLREFYIQRQKAELPAFLKVLRSLPKEQLNYKPHDRSPSAEQLVWTLTGEVKACIDVVDTAKAEWKNIQPPPLEQMIEMFENWSNELSEKVSKMTESDWTKTAQFVYEGKVVSEQPVSQFIWFILFDAIHHRGQLSAYIRPMGGKVPSIYGPSADDPGGM
jgi:uncharacterized damage-inducible protein DinB